jgi:D-alanyl-D-alanine dipeptidase
MRGPVSGFVPVCDVIPSALPEARYYTSYNFVGERIDGYGAPVVLLAAETARALRKAADALAGRGISCGCTTGTGHNGRGPFRPLGHGSRRSAHEKHLLSRRGEKQDLRTGLSGAPLGAFQGRRRRSHAGGRAHRPKRGDGRPFDFFGEISHHGTALVTPSQAANREMLKSAMEAAGFRPCAREWWHYTLICEPYPDTYFDFPIE